MLRSSRIPPLLSTICSDGIYQALLVTSDGEILGSTSASEPKDEEKKEELDMESIGALIAEISGDYRRVGNELLLLNLPAPSASQQQSLGQEHNMNQLENVNTGQIAGSGGASSGGVGTRPNFSCMIIQMDHGLIGVASTGYECLVIAVAKLDVPQGFLKKKLTTLAEHIRESFSQLNTTLP